eukprot:CAMPEP_0119512730 /NCGR_PEP_ID=MMETSP1344-20130328/31034_1 /TAXON_ID=236787 /ORGANISM="Florenciella parvula, Strain CCMP2471" /LENGTH=77 /DNA_ID=CAMNT_0007549879 /DNA_START=62 /DNA_END=292 /DNA_ORIENTATION=+
MPVACLREDSAARGPAPDLVGVGGVAVVGGVVPPAATAMPPAAGALLADVCAFAPSSSGTQRSQSPSPTPIPTPIPN